MTTSRLSAAERAEDTDEAFLVKCARELKRFDTVGDEGRLYAIATSARDKIAILEADATRLVDEIAELRAERDRLAAALAEREKDDGRVWCAGRDAMVRHLEGKRYTGKGHEDENSLIGMFARGVRWAKREIAALTPPTGNSLSPDAKEDRHGSNIEGGVR